MIKVLKYGFFVILFIFILLLLVPWLFKDEIFTKVKVEANKMLVGELFIEDVSLSLISDFPNLALGLEQVKYVGEGDFEGVELFNITEIRAELDLMSVITGDKIEVKEIAIIHPTLNVRVLENGAANYLILKEDGAEEELVEDSTEESSPFNMGINRFIIQEMNLIYEDLESQISTNIVNGNVSLSGNFSDVDVAITTAITMDELSVGYESINYLNKVLVDANMQLGYNQETGKILLGDNDVKMNNLHLLFNGWLQSFDEKVAMDLSFEAPHAEFKEILSMIPAAYMEGFEDIKTSGTFSLKGFSEGEYFYEGDNLPNFEIALQIENGNFQYPELPSAITNIMVNAKIAHVQGITDNLIVDMSKATLNVAGSPFKSTLFLKTPMSDPYIDFTLKTNLDLHKLTQVVPVEGTILEGILMADAYVKGNLSDFENSNYKAVTAGGWLKTKHMKVGTDMLKEPVFIDTAFMEITPQKFALPAVHVKLGKSDFKGSGRFDNLLSYALADDTLSGRFSLTSNVIDATELMQLMVEDSTAIETVSDSTTTVAMEIPGNLNLVFNAEATKVYYDNYDISDLKGNLEIKNSVAYLKGFSMGILNGQVLMDGAFSTPNQIPTVDFNFEIKNMDVKTSFTTFNTVQSFAPIAKTAEGNFSTKLSYKGTLDQEFSPDLNTLNVKGNLYTLGMILQPEIMTKVSDLLKNESLKKIKLKDADLSFEIANGRVLVKPTKIYMGDIGTQFSGSHGLDNTMDYLLESDIPTKSINIPAEIKALGLIGETIPVKLKLGGTFSKPTVSPVFGKGSSVKDVVTDLVNNAVNEAKDSIKKLTNEEKKRILAEAQLEADKLIAEAVKHNKNIKAEAKKQAEMLKEEARKQAAKLLEEANGDPLKTIGAKTAGDLLIKEADKQIAALQKKTNEEADAYLEKAKMQAAKIMKDAEEKANIQE